MTILELLGISSLNLIIWTTYGLMIGLIVHVKDNRKVSGGVISTVLFAVIGSVIGGYMASYLVAKK